MAAKRRGCDVGGLFVDQPTVEDSVSILRGLKERYESHHKATITDTALVAAAVPCHRYIGDRFLPDKAIDLVDEAASRLRLERDSMPGELDEDETERRIHQWTWSASPCARRKTPRPGSACTSASWARTPRRPPGPAQSGGPLWSGRPKEARRQLSVSGTHRRWQDRTDPRLPGAPGL